MRLNSMQNLYVDSLKDLYSAENQLARALPKMAEAASNQQLQQAFQTHLEETKGQIEMLRQIFEGLGESPSGEKCKGMEGLLAEGEEIIEKRSGDADVKDAALIGAAQKCEHYEISGYGTARTFAQMLGFKDAVDTLSKILDQEARTDELLTQIATGQGSSVAVNEEAMQSSGNQNGGQNRTQNSRSQSRK